jgi:acyl-ACP thioesterase
VSVRPATELLAPTSGGRTFSAERVVRLGDVDPAGELRFDAIGRYLQDVASDDALAADLPNALGWVVRRTMIRVVRAAIAGERVVLTTYCTGSGRSWAERRTTIRSERGAAVDAVSLWIQVDVATGRPARLGPEFETVYGAAAAGRVVSSKLSLPGRPPDDADHVGEWCFRRADLDQFGHVNNAAQLAVVEEYVDDGRGRTTAEIEYLGPAEATTYAVLRSGTTRWLVPVTGGPPVTALSW